MKERQVISPNFDMELTRVQKNQLKATLYGGPAPFSEAAYRRRNSNSSDSKLPICLSPSGSGHASIVQGGPLPILRSDELELAKDSAGNSQTPSSFRVSNPEFESLCRNSTSLFVHDEDKLKDFQNVLEAKTEVIPCPEIIPVNPSRYETLYPVKLPEKMDFPLISSAGQLDDDEEDYDLDSDDEEWLEDKRKEDKEFNVTDNLFEHVMYHFIKHGVGQLSQSVTSAYPLSSLSSLELSSLADYFVEKTEQKDALAWQPDVRHRHVPSGPYAIFHPNRIPKVEPKNLRSSHKIGFRAASQLNNKAQALSSLLGAYSAALRQEVDKGVEERRRSSENLRKIATNFDLSKLKFRDKSQDQALEVVTEPSVSSLSMNGVNEDDRPTKKAKMSKKESMVAPKKLQVKGRVNLPKVSVELERLELQDQTVIQNQGQLLLSEGVQNFLQRMRAQSQTVKKINQESCSLVAINRSQISNVLQTQSQCQNGQKSKNNQVYNLLPFSTQKSSSPLKKINQQSGSLVTINRDQISNVNVLQTQSKGQHSQRSKSNQVYNLVPFSTQKSSSPLKKINQPSGSLVAINRDQISNMLQTQIQSQNGQNNQVYNLLPFPTQNSGSQMTLQNIPQKYFLLCVRNPEKTNGSM